MKRMFMSIGIALGIVAVSLACLFYLKTLVDDNLKLIDSMIESAENDRYDEALQLYKEYKNNLERKNSIVMMFSRHDELDAIDDEGSDLLYLLNSKEKDGFIRTCLRLKEQYSRLLEEQIPSLHNVL